MVACTDRFQGAVGHNLICHHIYLVLICSVQQDFRGFLLRLDFLFVLTSCNGKKHMTFALSGMQAQAPERQLTLQTLHFDQI